MRLPRLFARRRKSRFLRLVGLSIVEAVTLYAMTLLFRELLIALDAFGPTGLPAYLPPALALCAVLIALAHWGANSVAESLGMDYSNALRLVLLRCCVVASRGSRPQRLGTSMARMIGDLGAVRDWVSQGLSTMIIASATLFAGLAGLAAIDSQLALHLALACLAALLLVTPPVALRLYHLVRELRRLRGKLSSRLGDLLLGASTVAYMGRCRGEVERVTKVNKALKRASVARTRTLGLLTALTVIIVPATVAWVSLLLVRGYPLSMEQPGAWTMLLFAVSLLSVSLTGLVRSLDQLISYLVARRRLIQLMQDAARAALPEGGNENLPLDRALSIEIRSVNDSQICLTEPLQARAGSTVALIGASGLGKSRLLRCLLQPGDDTGEITIGGLKMGAISPASLRRRVQWVTTEFALMRGSLLRNLRYASRIGHKELNAICTLCDLGISDIEMASQWRLDQAGRGLPSSLAARIRLARALASRPGVLLVDDAVFLYDPQARQALLAVQAEKKLTLVVAAPDEFSVAYLKPDLRWRMEAGNRGVEITPQSGSMVKRPALLFNARRAG